MIKRLLQQGQNGIKGIPQIRSLRISSIYRPINLHGIVAAGRTSLKMKSTNTTTFHKNAHILQNEHEQQGEIIGATPGESIRLNEDEEDSFPELNELKQYFLTCEKDEFDGLEDGFEDEPDIVSKFDLNEGGESDFSEEFEQAIANGTNRKEGSSEKEGKEKRTPVVALKSNAISSEPKSKRSNNDFDNSEKKGLMYLRKNKTNQPTYLERKFGLNIASEARERQADLQVFVLKVLQLLNAKTIQQFVQIIEYFKTKLTSQSFKRSQNVHEDFFMRQVFKLFETNKAEELMELFLKCDIIDININLFTNNVSDYEKTYEIKNKYKQFDAFSKSNQPNGGHFLLNELVEKYNNLDYRRYALGGSSLSKLAGETNKGEEEEIEDQIDIDSFEQSSSPSISIEPAKLNHQSTSINYFTQASREFSGAHQTQPRKQVPFTSNEQQSYNLSRFPEGQLFEKATNYEYSSAQNVNKLDQKIFDQLISYDQKTSFESTSASFASTSLSSGNIIASSNSFTGSNWNSCLLEDEFFPSASSSSTLSQQQSNQQMLTSLPQKGSIGFGSFTENFILEPSPFSQQKIMQIGRKFENQFDHNLIDDLHQPFSSIAAATTSTFLPSISNDAPTTSMSTSDAISSLAATAGTTPAELSSSFKLQSQDFTQLLNLESERTAISTKKINRIHNNKMVLKSSFDRDIQQHDEVIILKQEDQIIPKPFEPSNWVYMFHLPYNINEVPSYRTYLKGFVESAFGDIEEIHFFNYMDFFEIDRTKNKQDPTEIETKLRDSLQETFIQTNVHAPQKRNQKIPNSKAGSNSTTSSSQSAAQKDLVSVSDEDLLNHVYLNSTINPEFCQRSLRRTERILEKIQNKKEKKYNRSYAMIKFKSAESKAKCLTQDVRLFGVQNFTETFHFDDADYKRSLILSKIPWGINLQYFINKFNQQLKAQGLKHIKLSMEGVNLKKVVTKYFLLVKFNNFKDSLDVLTALQSKDFMIETSKLSSNHSYGSLKQGPKGLYEITDMVFGKDTTLLERVNERKVFEIWNIYKENTGYLNGVRTPASSNLYEDGTGAGAQNSNQIEIDEQELDNYNGVDTEVSSERWSSVFSKSSSFNNPASIQDQNSNNPDEQNIDEDDIFKKQYQDN